ncbi:MAG: AAA family ATPase [Alphaproteobacteria bacterium]|nr:AAA family ATPase [Alphaproteobacteria bacterium]
MYEQFYGLNRTPFAVTPDPAMLFMSQVHREALATIIYGVETRKGFIVCTGEVGTGKSTIIRAFFDQTLADAVKLIYIFTPQVSPLEMAQYICREMGMEEAESVFAAVPRLQMKLLELFETGKTVVLMIDEAQLLPPETLEFLRLLSNFETDTEKLIQIVLVGQPEVDTILARRDMRQVNQRVALRARLAPLSVPETFEYIEHRIRVSGAVELAQVMSPSAAWLIAEAAGGIPRVINILADNALIAGFGAGQRPLGSHLASATVREFLAKSGPAKPATPQRLSGGWRAAMRLRGALARERDEPDAFVPTAPPPASSRPAFAPPLRPAQARPQTPVWATGEEPASAIAAAPPAYPVLPASAPTHRGPPKMAIAVGAPISADDVPIVVPVFEPVFDTGGRGPSEPVWYGFQAPAALAPVVMMPVQRTPPPIEADPNEEASWPPPDHTLAPPSSRVIAAEETPAAPIRSRLPPRRP